MTLCKKAIRESDKVFDLVVADKPVKDEDIEEHLFDLGLLEGKHYFIEGCR